jgi:ribosome-associated protein
MVKKTDESSILAEIVVAGMQEIKAKDVVKIDLRGLSSAVSDFFIVCHAESDRQVKAIAASVEREVRKSTKEHPYSSEGQDQSEWIILDYVNVVAHIFLHEKREFYNLEGLWGDAEISTYENM